jgi:hypothetical protein
MGGSKKTLTGWWFCTDAHVRMHMNKFYADFPQNTAASAFSFNVISFEDGTFFFATFFFAAEAKKKVELANA